MARIFLSHSSQDKDFARRLATDLSRHGHEPWLDEWEIGVGESIVSSMQEGISKADYVLVALSPASVSSAWVNEEWKAAYWQEIENRNIAVLPILIEDCDIPLFLRSKKYIDFRESYNTGFVQLSGAIEFTKQDRRRKVNIWYLDDDATWLERFRDRHQEDFEIHTFNNVVEFLDRLQAIQCGSSDFPKIVLVDLYAPLSEFEVDRKLLEETNEKVRTFFQMEKALKGYVDDAWRPYGVEIVNSVREYHSYEELPIAIYTQRGLVLLSDELMMELERLHADWLLKNRFSAETERLILSKIMMRARKKPLASTKRILIVDDNPEFLDDFVKKHGKFYDIETITDQGEVLSMIEKLDFDRRFPDLLLIDLYYPRGSDQEALEKISNGNRKLREFHDFEARLRNLVAKTYEPIGMRVIEQIRAIYNEYELPVMVYTQCGLLLLDDRRMQRIEALGTGWLLKDRYSPRTEQAKIIGHIIRTHRNT